MKPLHFIQQQFIRLIKATGYSLAGLKSAFKTEPAFLLEVILLIILLPFIWHFSLPLVSKALLVSSLMGVLIVELLNSGIEAVIDRFSQERHPLAKKAKDVGSAAVFLSVLNALIVWGIILFV